MSENETPQEYTREEQRLIDIGKYQMACEIYKMTGMVWPQDDAGTDWYVQQINHYMHDPRSIAEAIGYVPE